MIFYIKECPDDTAILMTEGGRVVWSFPSLEEAQEAAENGETAECYNNNSGKRESARRAVA